MVLILCLMSNVYSNEEITITKIDSSCRGDSKGCDYIKRSFMQLVGSPYEKLELIKTIKILSNIDYIDHIGYSLLKDKNETVLKVKTKLRKFVDDIEYLAINKTVNKINYKKFPESFIFPEVLPLRVQEPLQKKDIRESLNIIKNALNQQGFLNVVLDHKLKIDGDEVDIEFRLIEYSALKIHSLNIIAPQGYFFELLKNEFDQYIGKERNIPNIKKSIQNITEYLNSAGYKYADIKFTFRFKSQKAFATLKLDLGPQVVIHMKGHEKNLNLDIKAYLAQYLYTYKRKLDVQVVENTIKDELLRRGYVEPKVNVNKREYKNSFNQNVIRYEITLSKMAKTKLTRVVFEGVNHFESDLLRELFYDGESELIDSGVYDEKYAKDFIEVIKQEYYQVGFVAVAVEGPKVSNKNNEVTVKYRVREGVRSRVKNLSVSGVTENDIKQIKKIFTNNEKKYFNPITLEEDLKNAQDYLSSQGYINLEIKNKDNIVTYKNENSLVDIDLHYQSEEKYKFRNLIVVGNVVTLKRFFMRELEVKKGQLLTDKHLKDFHTKLLGFGLFSQIEVYLSHKANGYADIITFVREKQYGTVEIALGFRTDMGVRLSGGVQYKNFDGMNKEVALNADVNQRVDTLTIDENRSENFPVLTEYSANLTYFERKIFNSTLDLNADLSSARRRYFAFDADILRASFNFNWDLFDWLTPSIRFQKEQISQFNATQEQDAGSFNIASITPGLVFDFRDNPIQTKKGALFSLSYELANPDIGSQSNDDLVIDYGKLTSRNRFYIPLFNGVLASSFTFGYQRNNATAQRSVPIGGIDTVGYIPNIKVFRLVGIDNVRGYEDDEINRTPNGNDISEVVVNNEAYLVNIKIEPRFYLTDSIMWGLFYDAGRVFLDASDIDSLRSSVGFTLKILTPVGTLDFDYGIKLLRKRDDNGNLESPGRLHVSIGFF
jgi:outer membrane protein insertion porin family